MVAPPLLEIRDFRVYYSSVLGDYRVVDGVDFEIARNEVVGLAGESGCGKSTLVEGVLRLVVPPGRVVSGEVLSPEIAEDWPSTDLLALSEEEFRQIRWSRISYIPQGSMNSLNPVMRIRDQIADAIRTHQADHDHLNRVVEIEELLTTVGLPTEVVNMYPHELSGGMKQRAIIAMAISLRPDLIVADEPTTALDVTSQRMVIQTLGRIRRDFGSTILLVSHDMPVHAQLADRLVVMYAGKVMEIGSVDDIFYDALHPYARALVATIPAITDQRRRLTGIPGVAPSPLEWPHGCRFHPRCSDALHLCEQEEPQLRVVGPGRAVACHLLDSGGGGQ